MANTTIHLISAANTASAPSATFEVVADAPISLYLIPAAGLTHVAGGAHVIIQRESNGSWFDALVLNGSVGSGAIIHGLGTFRAIRPAQQNEVGLDLVENI